MNIYDYDDRLTEIDLRDAEIEVISVTILSGDETGNILYSDGEVQYFDPWICGRRDDFYDGSYVVPKELVEQWIDYPNSHTGGSYKRQNWFTDLFDEWRMNNERLRTT